MTVVGVPLGRDLIAKQLPEKLRDSPCLFFVMQAVTQVDSVVSGSIKVLSA